MYVCVAVFMPMYVCVHKLSSVWVNELTWQKRKGLNRPYNKHIKQLAKREEYKKSQQQQKLVNTFNYRNKFNY